MSSFSDDLPSDVEFRKSSFSNDQQACVEVASAPDGSCWVRDSKDRTRPAHRYAPAAWREFLSAVRNREFA